MITITLWQHWLKNERTRFFFQWPRYIDLQLEIKLASTLRVTFTYSYICVCTSLQYKCACVSNVTFFFAFSPFDQKIASYEDIDGWYDTLRYWNHYEACEKIKICIINMSIEWTHSRPYFPFFFCRCNKRYTFSVIKSSRLIVWLGSCICQCLDWSVKIKVLFSFDQE